MLIKTHQFRHKVKGKGYSPSGSSWLQALTINKWIFTTFLIASNPLCKSLLLANYHILFPRSTNTFSSSKSVAVTSFMGLKSNDQQSHLLRFDVIPQVGSTSYPGSSLFGYEVEVGFVPRILCLYCIRENPGNQWKFIYQSFLTKNSKWRPSSSFQFESSSPVIILSHGISVQKCQLFSTYVEPVEEFVYKAVCSKVRSQITRRSIFVKTIFIWYLYIAMTSVQSKNR